MDETTLRVGGDAKAAQKAIDDSIRALAAFSRSVVTTNRVAVNAARESIRLEREHLVQQRASEVQYRRLEAVARSFENRVQIAARRTASSTRTMAAGLAAAAASGSLLRGGMVGVISAAADIGGAFTAVVPVVGAALTVAGIGIQQWFEKRKEEIKNLREFAEQQYEQLRRVATAKGPQAVLGRADVLQAQATNIEAEIATLTKRRDAELAVSATVALATQDEIDAKQKLLDQVNEQIKRSRQAVGESRVDADLAGKRETAERGITAAAAARQQILALEAQRRAAARAEQTLVVAELDRQLTIERGVLQVAEQTVEAYGREHPEVLKVLTQERLAFDAARGRAEAQDRIAAALARQIELEKRLAEEHRKRVEEAGGGNLLKNTGTGSVAGAGGGIIHGATPEEISASRAKAVTDAVDAQRTAVERAREAWGQLGSAVAAAEAAGIKGAKGIANAIRRITMVQQAISDIQKGKSELAEAAKSTALRDPWGATWHKISAGLFFAAAAVNGAGAIAGGGSGGAGSGSGRTDSDRLSNLGPGRAGTINVIGGLLNMYDPRQAQALADALQQLDGRRVRITARAA